MKRSKINGIILSAGLSRRMKIFKPLADYNGKPFIYNITTKLDKVCDEIIIVTGFNSDELKTETIKSLSDENQSEVLNKIKFVYNKSFQVGMFTSLQKGISETRTCEWILYHFVDQPGLPSNFYQEFKEQIGSEFNWIQPSYENRNGHPILIGKDLFELIINSSPDSNLREITKNTILKKKYWECDYKEIFQDIDTDEDYLRLE